jgi:hypothetical protein
MRTAQFRKKRQEAGQAVVMITLGITFLLGLLGLVVDLGYAYYVKQSAQGAADAAAMAAVIDANANGVSCGSAVLCQTGYSCPSSPTNSTDFGVACLYAKANGFQYAGGQTVTVSSGTGIPPTAAGVHTTYWATVTVTQNLALGFLSALGLKAGSISAQSTGAVVSTGSGCIYVLDSSASPGLFLDAADLVSTCGIYVNATSATNAIELNSASAYLCYGTSAYTCSAGTLPLHMVTGAKNDCISCGCVGNSYYVNGGGNAACPTPTYGSAVSDPLAALPAPSYSGCNQTNYSWGNISPAQTINPGVYCGGIKISGGTVTFNPGTYILNGGGLTIEGANTIVNGTGVFFYNTANGHTAGSLLMTGEPTVTFKANTSGVYQGILFMQDHNVCPSTAHTFSGNASVAINGTLYLHCTSSTYTPQSLLYAGTFTSGYYTALVVDTLTINGEANPIADPTGGQNTGFLSKTYLVQ